MGKNFTKFLFFGLSIIVLHFGMSSYSNNGTIIANNAVSGCSCHGPANINTVITVLGVPAAYTVGQVYPISVQIENQTKLSVGLNLQVSIGAISALGSQLTLVNSKVIRHTTPKAMTMGIATYTFNWTAPLTGNAPLVIDASANAVNNSSSTSGDAWNSYNVSVPLSLNGLEFNLNAKANGVTLAWKTIQEIDLKYFVVERSLDGIIFDSLDIVLANGSSTVGRSYDYTDKPSYSNDYFYRLRVVDIAGISTYTATKKANFNNGASLDFILFPNPLSINAFLNINLFNNVSNIVSINVFARNGNLVHSRRTAVKKGTNYLNLLQKFPQGFYVLEIVPEKGKSLKKSFTVS